MKRITLVFILAIMLLIAPMANALVITIIEVKQEQAHIRIEHLGKAVQFLAPYTDPEALKEVIRAQKAALQAQIAEDTVVMVAVQAAIDAVMAE